jgi:hypothetical protein
MVTQFELNNHLLTVAVIIYKKQKYNRAISINKRLPFK